MTISEALLPEFDAEIANTRRTLERVPSKPEFAPHPKSMPLGRLAPHIAQLAEFGVTVLTTPQFDFTAGSYTPLLRVCGPACESLGRRRSKRAQGSRGCAE